MFYDNTATTATARPVIQNCVFDRNTNGIALKTVDNINGRTEAAISNNVFSNLAGFPIVLWNTNYPAYTGNTFTNIANSAIVVGGKWNTSATWSAVTGDGGLSMPYVIKTMAEYSGFPIVVTIGANATLTLPASTLIKLDAGGQIVVDGTLNLQSTPVAQIVFTSYDDDARDDTNNNGTITTPAKSDWNGLYLLSSTTDFHDAVIKYSAVGLVLKNATTTDLNPPVTNCRFEQNAQGLNLTILSTGNITSLISGSLFADNDYGVVTVAGSTVKGSSMPTLQSNTFTRHAKFPIYLSGTASPVYINNTFSDNVHRAIALSGYFSADAILSLVPGDTNAPFNGKYFPYVVINDMVVNTGAMLTVPASSIIKFDASKRLVALGGLDVESTSVNKIYFTSYKDDYYDDTNADAAATTPARGNWDGVYIQSNDTVDISYTILKYSTEGLVVYQAGAVNLYPMVAYNIFSDNTSGVTLFNKTTTAHITSQIVGNQFTSNGYGLYTIRETTTTAGCAFPLLSGNTFTAHSNFPIYLNGSADPTYVNNTFSNNTHPAIALGGHWVCNATWTAVNGENNQPMPYVVISFITQLQSSAISLPAGTVVKFDLKIKSPLPLRRKESPPNLLHE